VECLATLSGGADRLATIDGTVPHVGAPLPGCKFAPRCRFAEDRCRTIVPPLTPAAHGGTDACLRSGELDLPVIATTEIGR
jgi:peptide/nickel transport system ATP-binding protein